MEKHDDAPEDVKRATSVDREIKRGEKDDTFEGYPRVEERKKRWEHCDKPPSKKPKRQRGKSDGDCCEKRRDKRTKGARFVKVSVFGEPCTFPKLDIIPRHCLTKQNYIDMLATPSRKCPPDCQKETVIKKLRPVSRRIKELAQPPKHRILMTLQENAGTLPPALLDNLVRTFEDESCLTPEQAAAASRRKQLNKRRGKKKKKEAGRGKDEWGYKEGNKLKKGMAGSGSGVGAFDRDAVSCQYLIAERFVKSILKWKCPIPKLELNDLSEVLVRRLIDVLEYTPTQDEDCKSQQLRFLADVIACWISGVLSEVAQDQEKKLEERCRKKEEEMKADEEEDEDDEEEGEDDDARKFDRGYKDDGYEDESTDEDEAEEKQASVAARSIDGKREDDRADGVEEAKEEIVQEIEDEEEMEKEEEEEMVVEKEEIAVETEAEKVEEKEVQTQDSPTVEAEMEAQTETEEVGIEATEEAKVEVGVETGTEADTAVEAEATEGTEELATGETETEKEGLEEEKEEKEEKEEEKKAESEVETVAETEGKVEVEGEPVAEIAVDAEEKAGEPTEESVVEESEKVDAMKETEAVDEGRDVDGKDEVKKKISSHVLEKEKMTAEDLEELFKSDLPFLTFGKIIDTVYKMIENVPENTGQDPITNGIHRVIYEKLSNIVTLENPDLLTEELKDIMDVVCGKIANWLRSVLSKSQMAFMERYVPIAESKEIRDWTRWLADISDAAIDWNIWLRSVIEKIFEMEDAEITRGEWRDWTKSVDTGALLWRRFHLQTIHQAHRNVTMMVGRRVVKTGTAKTISNASEQLIHTTDLHA